MAHSWCIWWGHPWLRLSIFLKYVHGCASLKFYSDSIS
uniref:Uncharacterized protein n=1 Tax=Rhizophora mucronata TaxID=61149 RepID=A0A2P2P6F0_RHIMU